MVSYFLRWTLLKFFSSFPDEQSQQKVRQLDRITCAVIYTSNEVKSPLLWEFWIYNFSLRILERVLGWKHCKYKEWVSFFLGSWGMNRSAEQTNRSRTASRFTRFVCPALRIIPHELRKKDTHSLNECGLLWSVWVTYLFYASIDVAFIIDLFGRSYRDFIFVLHNLLMKFISTAKAGSLANDLKRNLRFPRLVLPVLFTSI